MKVFIIVFTIALLFVVGSAGMMRYFDNKNIVKRKEHEDDKSN